jgi:hypothetical protein
LESNGFSEVFSEKEILQLLDISPEEIEAGDEVEFE